MNAFVATGAAAFASAGVNWGSDTIRAVLADASITPTYDSANNINNVQYFSDISTSVVGSPVTLSGKSDTAGVLVAGDLTFGSVTGNTVVRLWVYKWTGTASTSQLLLAYDTGTAGGSFPIVPQGSSIEVHWDTGAFKIAQI